MGLTNTLTFDFDEPEFSFEQNKPTEPFIEFKDDPVALACASYRHWVNEPHTRWLEFEHVTVLPEDREKAQALKIYYRSRLVMQALMTVTQAEPSQFRQKLYKVVTDCAELTRSDVGLLYRLPYFYQEDQDVDSVMDQTQSVTVHQINNAITGNFSLIKKVLRSRKHGDYYDYWLRREGDNAPFLFTVKQDNVLAPVWNSLIQQPTKLTGRIWTKSHQGFHRRRSYYQLAVTDVL